MNAILSPKAWKIKHWGRNRGWDDAIVEQYGRYYTAEVNKGLVGALTYCKNAMEQEMMYHTAIEKANGALAAARGVK